ncbi:MAG: hypothetical protein H6842_00790 [Rhodospirillaceae bacterium]|nr:hypothetical protein [Rhodospirillaceae bacterium]
MRTVTVFAADDAAAAGAAAAAGGGTAANACILRRARGGPAADRRTSTAADTVAAIVVTVIAAPAAAAGTATSSATARTAATGTAATGLATRSAAAAFSIRAAATASAATAFTVAVIGHGGGQVEAAVIEIDRDRCGYGQQRDDAYACGDSQPASTVPSFHGILHVFNPTASVGGMRRDGRRLSLDPTTVDDRNPSIDAWRNRRASGLKSSAIAGRMRRLGCYRLNTAGPLSRMRGCRSKRGAHG